MFFSTIFFYLTINSVFVVIFSQNSGKAVFIGCYKEYGNIDPHEPGSLAKRLLPDHRKDFDNLTPQLCNNECFNRGFKLAGMQYGAECYCSNRKLDLTRETEVSECNEPCRGDRNSKCGGNWRYSLYATGITDTAEELASIRSSLIGCYKEIEGLNSKDPNFNSKRLMPESRQIFDNLTPQSCNVFCIRKGYTLAGLYNGNECFCSNKTLDQNQEVDFDSCSKPCAGDLFTRCGGESRYTVWATGLGETLQGGLGFFVGCFKEIGGLDPHDNNAAHRRFMPEFRQDIYTQIPKNCYALCRKLGHKYAGLQYGVECYCSSKKLDFSRKVDVSECSLPCPGDGSYKCGGHWRISVYTTGLNRVKISSNPSSKGYQLGCFKEYENSNPDSAPQYLLTGLKEETSKLTPKYCYELCQGEKYKFAGLRSGSRCFCGNDFDASRAVPLRDCSKPCSGDAAFHCGADSLYHIYTTGFTASPEASQTGGSEVPGGSQPVTSAPDKNCKLSTTLVNGKRACKKAIIFQDNFNTIDPQFWTSEIKIASKPDYEFSIYNVKPENIFIQGGILNIKPTVLNDSFIENGQMTLKRCTGEEVDHECSRNSKFSILPPTQSARITTKDSFNFQYGIVEVEAKLPVGDWIISEIWLVPTEKVYGPYYESGKIRIATVRGNTELQYEDGRDMSHRVAECSVMVGYGLEVSSKSVILNQTNGWRDKFHKFTLVWTPDDIVFSVDGGIQRGIMTNAQGRKLTNILGFRNSETGLWSTGTTIAPFDRPFHLSLGVSVGGIRDFADGATSRGVPKPWSNSNPKAMLNFWNARNVWKKSWQDDTSLQIKSIKIKAL